MSPNGTPFHRVLDVDGNEVKVVDDDHVREVLLRALRWAIFTGFGLAAGGGIFFAKIYTAASDSSRDLAALRAMREADTARARRRDEIVLLLRADLDSLRITLRYVQPQIGDLTEDIRELRRALRQPR